MPSPTWPVSVKGIVIVENRVLMVHNDRSEWELPGGRLEPHESPEDCVARELREEVGLGVSVEDIVDSWVYPVLPGQSVLVIAYGCTPDDPAARPTLSHEHDDLRFLPVGELDRHPMPDGYRSSIRRRVARLPST